MQSTTRNFKNNASEALVNDNLQEALGKLKVGFVERRAAAAEKLPEFDALRDQARDIKNHTLQNIDLYLERFEEKVTAQGGHVHWARNSHEACQTILEICQSVNAKMVTKGKSMVSEEIGLNAALEKTGLEVVETDLGEYIIQLRKEAPSHIIAPAVHVLKDEVEADFRDAHTDLDPDRQLEEPTQLVHEAREVLRQKYLDSDVGITGANFLVAETGTSIIVTNEGNGDLTQTLPKVHIVIASMEKIIPTLEDTSAVLRVLARSATGQEFTSYTTFSSGPRREEDPDGPDQYHVVILDNGRSAMLGTEFQDMLRCIRCGACMNHCPVYGAVGGHAYGWVYPGPMGSVLTPSFIGVEEAGHLPNASTFCGRCEEVCPMRIPLPKMMRHYRQKEFEGNMNAAPVRWAIKAYGFMATRPKLWHMITGVKAKFAYTLSGGKGRFHKLPLWMGEWTKHRDFPASQGSSFHSQWKKKGGATTLNELKKGAE
ncbi:LutB/LldF family L-lactate oxidation iron-sulfur protein [Curvivirga aplysinae]|uniref:LutB/LldF family L-lactate oxidation iron-sulfur protein n=1 Tax=Curvivirga aplysinae TaxID=2529852 RepID=UPI0012BB92ED|nr:LutB/LldF family L-lactate oxidation iron-sulfur protein [Curvivirga aplysinae]MTI09088.1 iron-sulfur cluster-binding protein [Curvivirga aplysinae]